MRKQEGHGIMIPMISAKQMKGGVMGCITKINRTINALKNVMDMKSTHL